MDLIDWLIARQQAEGLSDAKFATRLVYRNRAGALEPYTRGAWNQLKRRGAEPSLRLVQAACRAYPESHELILQLALLDCVA